MFGFDAIELARVQFAFTIMAHIIFPALSIGLASYLAVLEGLWLLSGRRVYLDLFNYWLTPFSLAFGMGVVSGLVMSYQFGTNWAAFSDKAGPVIGPLMGYEVLTAFFLEAGFLGVMLFGREKVGPRLHFAATCIVATGTLASAFWILAVNSWMQTPDGYSIAADGRFMPESWWRIIFNPSFTWRLPHMVLACYLSVAVLVGGTGAWHLRRDRNNAGARMMFSMAMWMALLTAPAQMVLGDLHGINTLAHQPAKVAAMEGHFDGKDAVPLVLFGIPNAAAGRVDYAISIPKLSSLILTHDLNGRVRGLNDFPAADRPPVGMVFWAFRVMVGLGLAMIGLGLWSLVQRLRGQLFASPWLWCASVIMAPAGLVALLSGWVVTEVGRQPFTVYGLLRTADSASPIGAPGVGASLIAFVVVYVLVFGAGIALMLRRMAVPPHVGEPPPLPIPSHAAGLMPGPAVQLPAVQS